MNRLLDRYGDETLTAYCPTKMPKHGLKRLLNRKQFDEPVNNHIEHWDKPEHHDR